MKTQDEVMTGVICCLCDIEEYGCEECPYADGGCETATCEADLGEDVVALKMRLEKENESMQDMFCTLAERVIALERRIHDVEMGWISAEKRLPKKNLRVEGYCCGVLTKLHHNGENWVSGGLPVVGVTKWREL